jgi:hypothetical protein
MFENYALPQLNSTSDLTVLQLDGAPVHFGYVVHDCLNVNFSGQWIGRGGPIAWLPNSPELTTLEFFSLGLHESPGLQPKTEYTG